MRMHPGFTQRRPRSAFGLTRSAAIATATVVIAVACATVETPVVADPGAAFSLPLGKTATVTGTGVRITFNRVTTDSRCPVDVVCVWAGEARIELAIEQGGPADERTLSTLSPNEIVVGDLRIRFVGLTPAPKQSDAGASRAYVAQLVVSRL